MAVRAAGGFVIREGEEGTEVLLVHRPAYDDWSLPKGKALDGESDEDCAVREVEEETGLRCELGRELPSTSYCDARGHPKVVRYWAMRSVSGEPAPATEVDELRWLPLSAALEQLTWPGDRHVVATLADAV